MAWKVTAMGGGIYPYFRNILLGSGARGYVVQILIMSHIGGDDEDGGGNLYKIPKAYHREEGAEKGFQGSWNAENSHIYQPQSGNGGTVGVFTTHL